jgi:hypothetical protein
MATKTERLVGKLSVHDSEWRAGLARASSQFKAFSGGIGRTLAAGLGSARGAISGLGGMLKGAFSGAMSAITGIAQVLGVGGLLSGAGIVAGMKNIADLGGELSDVSARTGMAVKDLVILRQQLRLGGIAASDVTQYVRRMNDALMDTNKADLFKALGLDSARVLASGPVNALNSIISRVRELGHTAAQQKALSEIFGVRRGIQLMTLVVDPKSAEKARQMVGSMAQTLAEKTNELATISDNLEGIPVKVQQIFAGFTTHLTDPLLKATAAVANADFTQVGAKLGDQLLWAVEIFRGMWQNNDIWAWTAAQLKNVFMWGASYFTGVMLAAWNAVFSRENMMIVGNLFQAVGMGLAGEIQASMPFGDKEQGESKKRSAEMILSNTTGLALDMGAVTMKRFAESIANLKALPIFDPAIRANNLDISGIISDAAATRGVSARAPIQSVSDLTPSMRPPRASMWEAHGSAPAPAYGSISGQGPGVAAEGFSKSQAEAAVRYLGAMASKLEAIDVE